jgi:hypothetical protein
LESIAGGPVFGLSPVTQRILLSRVEAVNIVFSEPVRHWPSYCGERFVTIGIILGQEKSSTYSSEYASGFSRPCAAHLAAPPSPRYEGNTGQVPVT